MINTTIEQVKKRRLFYRDYYLKGINVLIAVLVLELLFTGIGFYIAIHRNIPAFYASSSDGILTALKAMPTPNLTNKPILT